MSRDVKVLVAGAGAWGRNHVRTLHALGALAGVVEVSAASRERVAGEYPGLPVWDSMAAAILEGAPMDGIVIATPAPTHTALATDALREGLGVLVEKPMAMETGAADRLVSEARAAGRVLMVGHLLLYQPAIQELKRLLDGGAVGKVLRIHLERTSHGRVRSAESVLWSFAPHDVAVLLYLAGRAPREVGAWGAAFLQPGIHDDVHLDLAFEGGLTAHIHDAWYWPEKRRGLTVLGDRGMLVHDEDGQTLTLHRKCLRGGAGEDRLAPRDDGSSRVFEGPGEPLRLEDQHFLHCLATGATPMSDGLSGLAVTRVLERADAQLRSPFHPSSKES